MGVLAYRDAVRNVEGEALRRELACSLERLGRASASAREAPGLGLLLLSAELETALEDLSWPARHVVCRFTDACAIAWWQRRALDIEHWQQALEALALPARMALKRPEGYAYYALDPAAYARAALALAPLGGELVIVGVRSVGTSLSAVACAAVQAGGGDARRWTVRPDGHAWDRRCCFDNGAASGLIRDGAQYLVVDEGPGLSGSTFLAVAEGLEAAGVARQHITLLTSHRADPARLLARDAVARWSRFRSQSVAESAPAEQGPRFQDVGAGAWRRHVFASEREWPFVWQSAERRKLLALQGPEGVAALGSPAQPSPPSRLLKFVGLPPYGEGPRARAQALADAGFSPAVDVGSSASGYLCQRWIAGRVSTDVAALATPTFVEHVVEYLAFRSRAFPAAIGDASAVEEMMRQNVREALGVELPAAPLELRHAVYADARLQAHEWVLRAGATWKVDASDHGDDHGFPGPCDSAWDLAGAIIELRLDRARAEAFLSLYQRRTGDDARSRIGPYLVAYLAERVGRYQIAALSTSGDERPRLDRELRHYTSRLRALVGSGSVSARAAGDGCVGPLG